jgi:predicted DCC family thiol-disulfide oxidoreductase YuxK
MDEPSNLILFYDGDCGFCNHSIKFIVRRERGQELYYTSLGSRFTESFFREQNAEQPSMNTVYFYKDGVFYTKSSAILKLAPHLRRSSSWLRLGHLLPRFIRDKIYDLISNRRHKIAGGYCYDPSKSLRSRFVD